MLGDEDGAALILGAPFALERQGRDGWQLSIWDSDSKHAEPVFKYNLNCSKCAWLFYTEFNSS